MKNCILTAAAVALIGLVGCNNGTPGGPGVDKAKSQEKESRTKRVEDSVRQAEDTFTLSVPTFSTKVKHGESKEVTIGIKRGKNFDQDVALKFDGLPSGVTADPPAPTIKSSETEAKINLKVADNASVGDFTVKVIGHPTKGEDATNELKLTIAKK
jgi:uncharacterized lipoprotein NlpE involved in copper resistance